MIKVLNITSGEFLTFISSIEYDEKAKIIGLIPCNNLGDYDVVNYEDSWPFACKIPLERILATYCYNNEIHRSELEILYA